MKKYISFFVTNLRKLYEIIEETEKKFYNFILIFLFVID